MFARVLGSEPVASGTVWGLFLVGRLAMGASAFHRIIIIIIYNRLSKAKWMGAYRFGGVMMMPLFARRYPLASPIPRGTGLSVCLS